MAYCDRCQRWFPHDRALYQHERDSSNHWQCDDCDRDFSSATALEQHYIQSPYHFYCQRYHYYCRLCDCHLDDRDDFLEHGDEYHYVCRECTSIFASANDLSNHNECSHYFCRDCDRLFQTRANLESHRASSIHTPRTIVCPGRNCGRAFVSVSALLLHAESGGCPSGITRQAVDAFVARMDRRNVITNPARMISGPGGYSPPTETQYLVTHATTWNGDAYECFLCNNEFATLLSLDRHLRSPRHRERIYRCPGARCGLEYSALSALCQHVERGGCGVRTNRQVQDVMGRLTSGMRTIAI
ncbi:hypothetical protein DFH11DRAFT_1843621 [Phellopilus nigrolimitatus]|nr:hypothetical protein DFH11DRAFT_1843621 [Phellopilus nigrolimitatus]